MENNEGKLSDNYFMGLAIQRARKAALRGDVPVGAIVVIDGNIYSEGGNEREALQDPTAHAEVVALRHAAETLQSWRLENATVYVTAEPCLLCTGAIYLARIQRVVFGCPNPKGGALRFVSVNEQHLNLNHRVEITGGVRELECAQLLRTFFVERRDKTGRDGRVVEGA
ncbi:MAG TPA: tRNA adenosine(34) deaminase TadA [Bdellovibrionota bacterium]|nr:tRNA adenosine(34) deaminase TadA [Bdellovibrionota bacterium]